MATKNSKADRPTKRKGAPKPKRGEKQPAWFAQLPAEERRKMLADAPEGIEIDSPVHRVLTAAHEAGSVRRAQEVQFPSTPAGWDAAMIVSWLVACQGAPGWAHKVARLRESLLSEDGGFAHAKRCRWLLLREIERLHHSVRGCATPLLRQLPDEQIQALLDAWARRPGPRPSSRAQTKWDALAAILRTTKIGETDKGPITGKRLEQEWHELQRMQRQKATG